jgi:hypothetical protein
MKAALKRFNLAAPKEKRLGTGKGRSTSTARQRGVGVRSVNSFYVSVAAACKGEVPPEAILGTDESPINGNGEHMEAEDCVYEIEQRNANEGAARSASCSSGKRISAVQTISADGHVYLPAMLVAGQKVQLAWTAKPYPETVTHEMVQNMVIIATPNGVETTESFLLIFEHGTLAPARKRINQMHPVYGPFRPDEEGTGLGQKIVVILDCDSTHGVDLKNEECSKELAKLCLKYNAELVPVPANTSTHLSPLDVAFFGSWKGMLRKVTGVVAMVHSGADASRGICLHPKRLEAWQELPDAETNSVRSALDRAQGMKAALDPRSHCMAFCLIWVAKRKALENAARESFRKPGIYPLDKDKMLAIVGEVAKPVEVSGPQTRVSPRTEQRSAADASRLKAIKYLQASAGRDVGVMHRSFDVAVAALEAVSTVGLGQRRLASCTMGVTEVEKHKRNLTLGSSTMHFSAKTLREGLEKLRTNKEQKLLEAKAQKEAEREAASTAKKAKKAIEKAAKAAVALAAKVENKRVADIRDAERRAEKEAQREAARGKKAAEKAAPRATAAAPVNPKKRKHLGTITNKPKQRPRTKEPRRGEQNPYRKNYAAKTRTSAVHV